MQALQFRKYFGAALEEARTNAGLPRQAIADVLGVDQATVWRWETGEYWPQRPDEVVAVYEREAKGLSALDLWNDAVKRANEADAKGSLERFLMGDPPTVRELDQKDADKAVKAARQADDDSRKPPRK